MPEERQETRAEEVARVRGYLASQSMRRTPAQLVETVQQAHQQFLAAIAAVPDTLLQTTPSEGEWSALDVLLHVRNVAAIEAASIPAVIERGEQPPDIEDTLLPAPREVSREGLLAELEQLRQRLFAAVLAADPQAHLDITWGHIEFGKMLWREWMLFARVHALDHARQVQTILAALIPAEEGAVERETRH